ncbi:MAG: GPR endopeptidase [Firmicutes bacterium]|nr:GPR endopeptidase [Bacillota bacterium]
MNFSTDLADERRDIYRKANKLEDEIPGIEAEDYSEGDNIKVSRVKIVSEEGEKAIGKPKGTYVTIYLKKLKIAGDEEIEQAAEVAAKELKPILDRHVESIEDILVVGLGNMQVTPDALGPKVAQGIDITRHIINYMPQYIDKSARPVSAVAPGVLGTTGIETLEILKGIVDNIKPKLMIVIDSLASKSIERISSTIQIADTGIVPGAGVGNKRSELSINTLGIPVIAIGVPMVVEAATIISDGLDLFAEKIREQMENNVGEDESTHSLYDLIQKLENEDKYEMIKQVLVPADYNLIVTPKEIDDLIENMSKVVSKRN